MRWSKLKKVVEEGFAPAVQGRVEVMVTRYRNAHDQAGRWGILIDGEEVCGLGDMEAEMIENELIAGLVGELGLEPSQVQGRAQETMRARAQHKVHMFNESVFDFTNMSIDAALESGDVIQRCLAILDRRTGKRRLERLRDGCISTTIERRILTLRSQG